jgi:hypothetical protein
MPLCIVPRQPVFCSLTRPCQRESGLRIFTVAVGRGTSIRLQGRLRQSGAKRMPYLRFVPSTYQTTTPCSLLASEARARCQKGVESCTARLAAFLFSWSRGAVPPLHWLDPIQASPLSTVLHVPVLEIPHRMTIESISDRGRESRHLLRALILAFFLPSLCLCLSVAPAARISAVQHIFGFSHRLSASICSSPVWTCGKQVSLRQVATHLQTPTTPTTEPFTSLPSLFLFFTSKTPGRLHTLAYTVAVYIFTPTYCHTATHMVFNTDPDICSHIQGFASTAAPTKNYAA